MQDLYINFQHNKKQISGANDIAETQYLEDILESDPRGFEKKNTIKILKDMQTRISNFTVDGDCQHKKSDVDDLAVALDDAIAVVHEVWDMKNS